MSVLVTGVFWEELYRPFTVSISPLALSCPKVLYWSYNAFCSMNGNIATCQVPEQQEYDPTGKAPLLASAYCVTPRPSCFKLFEHCDRRADSRADCTAGSNRATSTPIIAMTTNNS